MLINSLQNCLTELSVLVLSIFAVRSIADHAIFWCGEGQQRLHKNWPGIFSVAWAVSENPDIQLLIILAEHQLGRVT